MPDLKEIKEFIIEWNEVNTADYYEASDQICLRHLLPAMAAENLL